jgi:hypothetical protein
LSGPAPSAKSKVERHKKNIRIEKSGPELKMSKSSSNGIKDAKDNPAPWDEDDFIAALGRLETMHGEVGSPRNRPRPH